jgi:hypothetical protein
LLFWGPNISINWFLHPQISKITVKTFWIENFTFKELVSIDWKPQVIICMIYCSLECEKLKKSCVLMSDIMYMSRQAEFWKHQLKAARCLREAVRQSSENYIGQPYTQKCFVVGLKCSQIKVSVTARRMCRGLHRQRWTTDSVVGWLMAVVVIRDICFRMVRLKRKVLKFGTRCVSLIKIDNEPKEDFEIESIRDFLLLHHEDARNCWFFASSSWSRKKEPIFL